MRLVCHELNLGSVFRSLPWDLESKSVCYQLAAQDAELFVGFVGA